MVGTPEYRLPGPDDRRAVQLPAVLTPGQRRRPLRPEPGTRASTTSRSAASTSTCATPATGTSRRRPLHDVVGAGEPRRADSGRRGARPVAVEPGGARLAGAALRSELHAQRVRQLFDTCRGRPTRSGSATTGASTRPADGQPRRALGRRPEPGVAAGRRSSNIRSRSTTASSRAATSATRPTSATGRTSRRASASPRTSAAATTS